MKSTCRKAHNPVVTYVSDFTGMGYEEDFIARSISFFTLCGGHCDCEISFNMEAGSGPPQEGASNVADPAPDS